MKYIIYIDYKAYYTTNSGKVSEFIKAEAKNLLDAIAEADAIYDMEQDNIYLIRIMEKVGKAAKENGCTAQLYKAILCKRSEGWHRNTATNGENTHHAFHTRCKGWECIETI